MEQKTIITVLEKRQQELNVGVAPFQEITLAQLKKSQKMLEKENKKEWGVLKHSIVFYILSFLILSVYAGKACPIIDHDFVFDFLHSLLLQVGLLVGITLIPIYILRLVVCYILGKNLLFRCKNLFYILFESSFFILWGLVFFIISTRLGLLMESTLKLTIGSFMFGFFSVLNMFILRSRFRIIAGTYSNKTRIMQSQRFVSIQVKFIILSIVVLALVGIVTALTGYKNFLWLIHSIDEVLLDIDAGILSVFKEIIFIIAVFMGWMIITIYNYSTNIKVVFVLFNNTIYNIFANNFNDVTIPPILNDEFGVMGENINMITGELKEKEKIKSTFGKFVSPKIADIILQEDVLFDKRGESRDIVVLFSDIRNFTNTTNTAIDPHDIVERLNEYFTNMVEIVEKHDGLVDKFIGDALMVLFGYDDIVMGINNAVYSAIEMHEHLINNNNNDFSIGVGIGMGSAIVGSVGSPNRLDFTAIGDVVNLSSRLESATKAVNVDILINGPSFDKLYDNLKALPWKKFKISVKGIDDPIEAYGLKMKR